MLASLEEPDIQASAPIALKGDILLARPFEGRCDALCAALLKTPGVTSVRVQTPRGHSNTYRIVPDSTPGKRSTVIGHGLLEERRYDASDPLAHQRALEAEWNLMMSEGKALLQSDDAPETDFTIAIEDGPAVPDAKPGSGRVDWSLEPSAPHRKALTITGAGEQVLLRQSILSIFAPAAPLLIGISGGIENFRFGWARRRLGDGRMYAEVPVNRLLLDHTSVSRGVDMEAAKTKTREELARALDDPRKPVSDPAFALANQWMDSFRANDQPLGESDRRLLVRILEDPRVRSSDGLWAIIKQVDGDSADLRRLAARRYLAATDKKEARHWVNALAGLPVGAYADPLPEERAILADPAVSRFATGLIKRQGDRGVDAVPDLLRLLREYSVYDPGKYGFSDLTAATDAVRSGFRRIGPAASFARPEIEQLLASPGLEYRYKTLGQEEWDTLLVVLGKPVETLAKPENRSGTEARYRERVAQRAAKPYDSRRD
ncbi:MAG: hypothetical protein EOQ92_27570 [Mesorhizobium sp.]|nr:hypothetical protein [Mesorhizobium sp.]RWI15202.1 MAG: hypothetical protein EOQ92_27570 [Mesorhizobium sp.]TIQ26618.1 MAG: hypothetical protein E5X54_24965 [Mesorhizobium sp.]